jgi:hypothetical protein
VREYEQSRKTNQPEASAVSSLSTTVPNPTSSSTSEQPQADEESRILTFAELKELVENGRLDQIPNNKVIPNDLNVSRLRMLLGGQGWLIRRITAGSTAESVNSSDSQETLGDRCGEFEQ